MARRRRLPITADLERFFAARERYEPLGIPWRRGYLLHGPPGTGKTSLVTALASELSLNVCVLSLASPNVTDEKIGNLLASVPRRSVILIEDACKRDRSLVDVHRLIVDPYARHMLERPVGASYLASSRRKLDSSRLLHS